jgi:hypothetical protein
LVSRAVAAASLGAVALSAHALANLRHLRTPPDGGLVCPPDVAPVVSVLIPARDEAARIAPCIAAVLAALPALRDLGTADAEVLVLDDNSTDGTAEAVRSRRGGSASRTPASSWPRLPTATCSCSSTPTSG